MSNPESAKQQDDLAEARLDWAFSFLTDWLIPTIEINHIDGPSDIIELRQKFPPIGKENKGTDFSMQDVLDGALTWRAHNQKMHPNTPEYKLPGGKALHLAIYLLRKAVADSAKSEEPKPGEWYQTTFLND